VELGLVGLLAIVKGFAISEQSRGTRAMEEDKD